MNIYYKLLDKARKFYSKLPIESEEKLKNLFLVSGILVAGMPILSFSFFGPTIDSYLETNTEFLNEERLTTLEQNTLIPTSNTSEPEPKVVETLSVVITGYSSTVWQTDDTPFITASNKVVRDGIIANNLLPFGTRVRIPELFGDKIFVVEDRMNSKKSNYHFDIWFSSYSEAKVFGVKRSHVEILEG